MSSAAASPKANLESDSSNAQSVRETVESIVVAFILAFLFRAFVAEAFVIPTGSMAPTLMGAHKDIVCDHCGRQYQAGVSFEFDANGRSTDEVGIASTCSICRGVNAYDLVGNPNHKSFSGDRILVSKFDYVLHKPDRWDVFVFKFYDHARMNYIKRLVGLPGEQLLIRDGDVYVKSEAAPEWTIARKPPRKIKAMRQIISDTSHRVSSLIEQGWPSMWQPLSDEASDWTVNQAPSEWSATLAPTEATRWLRYYHNFVPEADWIQAYAGDPIPIPPPKTAKLITDYLAYNSSYKTNRQLVYSAGWTPNKQITTERRALDLVVERARDHLARRGNDRPRLNSAIEVDRMVTREDGDRNDGLHWVADLMGEFVVEVESDGGLLLLDLVEFGIHFQCAIDVATGTATLTATDQGVPLKLFDGASELSAQTSVRGPGSYRLELANFDDQLVLWVNGSVASFDQPTTFDSNSVRSGAARRPYWTPDDPLDAAPVAIGGRNIALTVSRAAVHRDIYYIAIQPGSNYYSEYTKWTTLRSQVPDPQLRGKLTSDQAIAEIYAHPEWWSETDLFSMRGELFFDLADDHYFPMGDNSSHSSDARAWRGNHYVEEKYLLGKALLVFWPHMWNTPVPFTPNFSRMGLIR